MKPELFNSILAGSISMAIVVAQHGSIVGSHWLAVIDAATIPAA